MTIAGFPKKEGGESDVQFYAELIAEVKANTEAVKDLKIAFDLFRSGIGQRVELLTIDMAAHKAKDESVAKDVEELKTDKSRFVWMVVGAVILSLLSLVGIGVRK